MILLFTENQATEIPMSYRLDVVNYFFKYGFIFQTAWVVLHVTMCDFWLRQELRESQCPSVCLFGTSLSS